MLRRIRGIKKKQIQSSLLLAKIFQYLFVHQKDNPHKPLTKVKITKEEMKITLENIKKVVTYYPISALKRKTIVEKGGALGVGMKRE
jgi:hypothetical protein